MAHSKKPTSLGRDSSIGEPAIRSGPLAPESSELPGSIGHAAGMNDGISASTISETGRNRLDTAGLKPMLDICDRYRNMMCDDYDKMTSGESNIVSMEIEGYEYVFDLSLERVVGAFGYSYVSEQERDKKYMSDFLGRVQSKKKLENLTDSQQGEAGKSFRRRFQDKYGADFDRGHFISMRQGGVYDINLFPQRSDINQGKIDEWRDFERRCVANPGTFCFVRPFYEDDSWVPTELEYGILVDGNLESKMFPNR